jgi:hypothetical protein
MVISMKMAVFWVVVPCRLVKFTSVSEVCIAFITLYQSTWHCTPEDSHQQ